MFQNSYIPIYDIRKNFLRKSCLNELADKLSYFLRLYCVILIVLCVPLSFPFFFATLSVLRSALKEL